MLTDVSSVKSKGQFAKNLLSRCLIFQFFAQYSLNKNFSIILIFCWPVLYFASFSFVLYIIFISSSEDSVLEINIKFVSFLRHFSLYISSFYKLYPKHSALWIPCFCWNSEFCSINHHSSILFCSLHILHWLSQY